MTEPRPDTAWEVVPHEQVGPLQLGMTREQVISAIGPQAMVETEPVLVEAHDDANVQVTYDPAGQLVARRG